MAEKPIDLTKLRNMGIIAHIDAGKTTTTEHILYYAGAIHKLGGVDEGTTITDWMELEQEKGITIQSACIPFRWKERLHGETYTLNLIDTPGHVDFTAEVERALRVLDGCVVVFDAQKGVEAQSETVWRQADKYKVPRLIFMNKMDIVGANFANAVDQVRDRLQGKPVAVTIPIGAGGPKDSTMPFRGLIDLVSMESCYFEHSSPARPDGKVVKRLSIAQDESLSDEQRQEAHTWRDRLFDAITEADDKDLVTSAYLAGEQVPAENVHQLLRQRTLKNEIQPVMCGSGREHIGVQVLLDAICRYLPSPLDRPPVVGKHPGKDKKEKRKPDPKEPFAALIFKLQADEHGELYYLRVYSGTLKSSSRPYNAGKGIKEFVTKIYHVQADPKDKEPLEAAYAGDIVAVIGPKQSITSDTLCDPQHPILLDTIAFAESVVSMSIEPESTADRAKMEQTLTTLAREDPTFRWQIHPDTGQTLISGMGVLHLETKLHKVSHDFQVDVRVGKPLVSFRESLRRAVRIEGECVRQTGTSSLFAKVMVEFESSKGEQPITVVNRAPPEKLTPLFLASAEQGIRGALQSGELGYPVMNVKAVIVDGEMDQQSSNETAFQAAGADAVHKALRDNIVLLEPIMHLEVTVPEEYLGPVQSDLMVRRADIDQLLVRGNLRVIEARVPLRLMFDYADRVRSLSQGRASSTMEPHSYAPAPDDVLHALLHPEEGV
jgi:elongation factor G